MKTSEISTGSTSVNQELVEDFSRFFAECYRKALSKRIKEGIKKSKARKQEVK